MNKQQLASTIWESANQMRSKIEANEYKDFILGFIFYKYLSEKELRFFVEQGMSQEDITGMDESDEEFVQFTKDTIGYFIAYENLFSTWLSKGDDFDVSDVRKALSAFDRLISPSYKKVFEKIFNTLQTGLSKLGESASAQTKSISGLLQLIKKIPMDGRQDYDVLGFIYEYLISMFAANAGKKAGEFYTPHEVSVLMSEIVADHLKDRDEIRIYDPTSGSGSLLINIGAAAKKHLRGNNKINYYAQELKENTYNLTRMNLVMRGIEPGNIYVRNGDTLEEDWPFFESDNPESYQLVRVDAVVSNPPYSQKWDTKNKKYDPRFSDYGVAPKGKADYAFLLHELYHLEDNGIMTIVLPHGVLFRGNEEGEIRKNLIEKNNIDAIIGLPENIFFGTNIATLIMVLKRNRDNSDVLIIDASKGFEKSGKSNVLRASDIKRIADTIHGRLEIPGYSVRVSKEKIRENDYNLNIPRYIDSFSAQEKWDIHSIMFGGIPVNELDDLSAYLDALPGLREDMFHVLSENYAEYVCENIKEYVSAHQATIDYYASYDKSFDDFRSYLVRQLINNYKTLSANTEEGIITENIFGRLATIKNIDKYEAYQILDDNWRQISVDIEILQTEGDSALTQVDPNMVTKKKDDKEIEVQDGWVGHILPFELVQRLLLPDDLAAIKEKEAELNGLSEVYEEILDSLSDDEKSGSITDDSNTSFSPKGISEKVAEILEDVETEEILALKEYNTLEKKADKLAFPVSHTDVDWNAMNAGKNGLFSKAAVNTRIGTLKRQYEFPVDSFEAKILRVADTLDMESSLKKQLREAKAALHEKTKTTIENMSRNTALMVLEEKWITPICSGISALPRTMVSNLCDALIHLDRKYKTTFEEVGTKISESEKTISEYIGMLNGNSDDMEGLHELQKLIGGIDHE